MFMVNHFASATFVSDDNGPMILINIMNYYCPPFYVSPQDAVSTLYAVIEEKFTFSPNDISILFKGNIIPKFVGHQSIGDIGLNEEWNDIQIVRKPDFVAMLEVVSGISNLEQIPWIQQATDCLFDFSSIRCQNGFDFGRVDLSHLDLMGYINIESLPQSVRTLDLSFNDLDNFNLNGLCSKSVERLNIEHNRRWHVNTNIFESESPRSLSLRALQVSSDQIFVDSKSKSAQITRFMSNQRILNVLIVDGVHMTRGVRMGFYEGMLNVVKGVTNKKQIPWYSYFENHLEIPRHQYALFGMNCNYRGLQRSRARYKFDLSGLGLEGHIDLGYLPPNVFVMDLHNNNLSTISFSGNGKYNLRVLNIQKNDNLAIDLSAIDSSSSTCCLFRAHWFSLSSNQLYGARGWNDSVRQWLFTSNIHTVMVNDVILNNDADIRAENIKARGNNPICECKMNRLPV